MTKPVREADLAEVLRRWLEEPSLDRESIAELQSQAGDDETFMLKLFATYVEQSDGFVESLVDGDAQSFERIVHTLGGSSRYVGAMRLADLGSAAESDARKDPNASRARHVTAIQVAYADVRREMSRSRGAQV